RPTIALERGLAPGFAIRWGAVQLAMEGYPQLCPGARPNDRSSHSPRFRQDGRRRHGRSHSELTMTTYTQESQPNPQLTIALLQNELAATNHEVMLLTLELEQRVAERTSQLSNANKALQKEVRERRQAEEE